MPETAQETGADAFVRALRDHGVEVMFGLPPARTSSLRRWPDEHDVRAAVALIAAAERPILVLGSDAAAASEDAPVVQRLRAAGAIVIGKTHTVEYAFGGWGTNATVGTPHNPRDMSRARAPGGPAVPG